jgi:hypothetical protein
VALLRRFCCCGGGGATNCNWAALHIGAPKLVERRRERTRLQIDARTVNNLCDNQFLFDWSISSALLRRLERTLLRDAAAADAVN